MKTPRVTIHTLALVLALFSTLNPQFSTAFAQGTAFTYQGRLNDGGAPVNGTYDLVFTIYDLPTGPGAFANQTNPAVAVSNGLFAVTLDLGLPGIFTGPERWLEIGVRSNATGGYTTLSPRQKLTPTPYAIMANSASNLLGALPAAQLTSIGNTNGTSGNFFVGPSGNSATSGSYNTANGVDALENNTSGYANTANGYGALFSNTIGHDNTANGYAALYSNTNGNHNTANGVYALNNNTSGSYNTANGFSALSFNTSGSNNIALGYLAGNNITTGSSNIDIGNPGLATDTNIIRIGTGQTATYLAGTIHGDGGSLTNLSASQLTSGTIPLAQLPAAVVTNNQSGVNISGTFNGDGGSLSNLNSSSLVGPLTVAADPVSLGHIDDGANALGVAVSGDFAYLANWSDGLRVYNIANPTNPVSVGHIDDGGVANGVAVSGNFAYLANGGDGLRVYNIANPANPVSIGHINDGAAATGVAMSGNFAYLANESDGLRVYNIANPTNPVSIGHSYDGGAALGVAVSGNFAYLANYDDGLRVYNIANPTNPVSIGHIDDGAYGSGVAVSGNFAYLANGGDGLRVYNIANPTNPVSIGHSYDGGVANGVAMSGNFAYLANWTDGLRVYNIANPANPVSIGHFNDGGNASGVAVSGNYAYLANSDDGLRVYGLWVASAPAFRGDGSLLTGLNADNITSGTLSTARIPNLDASKITTGTLADARLSANVALRAGGNAFLGNQTIGGGNVGIGLTSPLHTLHVGNTKGVLAINGAANKIVIEDTNAVGRAAFLALAGPGASVSATRVEVQLEADVSQNRGIFGTTSNHELQMRINNNEVMRFWTNGNVSIGNVTPTNKLHVAGGVSATAFVTTSDRNAKENFAAVSPLDVLNKVTALPITTWTFKTMRDGRHMGPMAQDFYAAFGLGGGDTTITSVDPDGVALAAIKGLNEKVEDRSQRSEVRIQKLEAENTELKQRLARLENLISKSNKVR